MQRRQDGFSLVEILVILLIVGILAAIAIPVFNGQRDKAKDRQAQDFVSQAQDASDNLWAQLSSRNQTYGTQATVRAYIQKEVTGARIKDYSAGSPSTGPNDITISREQPEIVTFCAKARSGRTFCARGDQSGRLTDSGSSDETSSNAKSLSFSNGNTEAAARTALAPRSPTALSAETSTSKRGWSDRSDCAGCTAGALVAPPATATGGGAVNDFAY